MHAAGRIPWVPSIKPIGYITSNSYEPIASNDLRKDVHNTQYTIHNTRHTINNTQYTVHNTQYTIQNTQWVVFQYSQVPEIQSEQISIIRA